LATPCADGSLAISFESFERFVEELRRIPEHGKKLTRENAHLIFQSLDVDGNLVLSCAEFLDACESLLQDMWITYDKSVFIRVYGFKFQRLSRVHSSGALDSIMSAVLSLNSVFVIVQAVYVQADFNPPAIEAIENLFSLLYMLDVLARVAIEDFSKYWSVWGNRFDFVTSSLLFFTGLVTTMPAFRIFRPLLAYLNTMRLLRVVRLIRKVPRFEILIAQLADLWVVSGDMFLMLAITMLTFALLGNSLFGGEVWKGNPRLQGVALVEGYELWNFNDMSGSFLTVFNILINSYVPEYVDMLNRLSSVPYAGTVYCAGLFFVGVNVGFNIVTAFLLDVFVSMHGSGPAGVTGEAINLDHVRSRLQDEGKVLHVRIPADLKRMRALAGVIGGLEDAIMEARKSIVENGTAKELSTPEDGTLAGIRHKGTVVVAGD